MLPGVSKRGKIRIALCEYLMAFDSSQLTPDQAQRDRLIGGLSKLIRQRGWERFVTGLFVEPTSAFFPDTVAPNIGGVRLLTHRLMVYAGLGHLNPVLHLHDSGGAAEAPSRRGSGEPVLHTSHDAATDTTTVAGWFAGIEDGNCIFGLDVQQTLDVDGLIGVLSHEVCHAYRHHFGLEVPTREVEEELTDLTTVFLGFGILSANASYRFRTSSTVEGGWISSSWSVHRSGYLSPQDMCFLLAVQAVAMGFEPEEVARLEGHLDKTQRRMFTASYDLLSIERDELRAELGIPLDEGEWPEPSDPTDQPLVEAMKRFRAEPGDEQSVLLSDVAEDKSRPTFRVVHTRAVRGFLIGFGIGMLLFATDLAAGATGSAKLFVVSALGWWIGHSRKYYVCSNPSCETSVAESDTTCSGCKRPIAHTINKAHERLAAEEALTPRSDDSSSS